MKKEYWIITIFVTLKLGVHMIMNLNAGFDGDEIMHIEAGNHLAWGYMTIQPFVGLMASLQGLFHSESVFIHHLSSHVVSVLILLLSGKMVMKLGGNWKTILLVFTCILFSPGFTLSQHIFTPLVFEQLFWLLSFYFLVSYCQKQKIKYLILLAVALALGFMTKLSILILIAGLGVSILIYHRYLFADKYFYLAFGVFILLISPNILWQNQHGWPSLDHMLVLHSRILTKIDLASNFELLIRCANPLVLVVCLIALIRPLFTSQPLEIKTTVVALSTSFFILFIFNGQFHYYFPVLLIALIIGSVQLKKLFDIEPKSLWSYVTLLIVVGVVLSLQILPVMPLKNYISYNDLDNKVDKGKQLFFTPESIEDNKTVNQDKRIPINLESYYTTNDWTNLVSAVNDIYQKLPQKQKHNCKIWTRCYTQASAINFHGQKYGLPVAFSQHGNCHAYIPEFDRNTTIIVVANAEAIVDSTAIGSFFKPAFDNLNWKQAIFCPYARMNVNAYFMLYLGHGLRYNSDALKRKYKDFIYE